MKNTYLKGFCGARNVILYQREVCNLYWAWQMAGSLLGARAVPVSRHTRMEPMTPNSSRRGELVE